MSTTIDEQFIDFIVKSIVSKPDAVQVKRTVDDKGVLLELTVDPEDLGRVIGKRGATAQSLRTLLRALGTKNDARYNLKIVDNGVKPERNDDEEAPKRERREDRAERRQEAPAAEPTLEQVKEELPAEVTEPEDTYDESDAAAEKTSDAISQTRKELAELDDLDI